MPTKPVASAPKITSWSFSRFYTWRECAAKAKYKFIMKLTEPEGPALAKGNAVHKDAENYALGKINRLPPSLANFKEEFAQLRKEKQHLVVEQQWGLTNKWAPAGWFGKETWCRVILDAAVFRPGEADVIDHKTGKVYPYHQEQLSLFAVATFAQDPTIKQVTTKLWYLDQGEEVVETYKLKDVPKLKKEWEQKVKPMLADARFAPNPGAACKYCHFKKAKGGPCEY